MKTKIKVDQFGIAKRVRLLAFLSVALLALTLPSQLLAQSVSWTDASSSSSSTGFWTGISAIYALIWGVLFVIGSVVIGVGWFKYKEGDIKAALLYTSGGMGMALTPGLVQWFRTFGGNGSLFSSG